MIDRLISYFSLIFSFDQNAPLLFTQFYFWAFFAIVFAVFSLIHNKFALRNAFLFFVSLFFYYKTSGSYVLILFSLSLSTSISPNGFTVTPPFHGVDLELF
jgi:hypothetical protein